MQDVRMNIYSSLRLKERRVNTKKDCILTFLKNPTYFLNKERFSKLFMSYIESPCKTSFKRSVRLLLLKDKAVQSIRSKIKFIFADRPIVLFLLIVLGIIFLDISIHFKCGIATIVAIGIMFNVSACIFYTVDHALSVFSIFKSAIRGSSAYFADSYLDLIKAKSDKFNFLYFDDSIDSETRQLYEEWIEELLSKLSFLNDFNFNIFIADENSNIIDESRKMVAIYDTPYQKVYENSDFVLGLYSSAGATVICKNISKEYFDNVLNSANNFDLGKDVFHFSNNNAYLKKYHLYHEIAHLITMDLDSTILLNEKCISIFNKERHFLYPAKDDYFVNDIKEYMAESLARYLLEGRVGDLDLDIDFKSTDTYKMIVKYSNRLLRTCF